MENLNVNYNNTNIKKRKKLSKVGKTFITIGLISTLMVNGLVIYTVFDMNKGKKNVDSNSTSQTAYIDFDQENAKEVVEGTVSETLISSNIDEDAILSVLDEAKGFSMEEYYNLDNALKKYETSKVQSRNNKSLLDENNNIDPDKLYEMVIINNDNLKNGPVDAVNTFYSDASSDEIRMICKLIAETCNNTKDERDITEVANILTHLKIFRHETTADCAAVTDDLVFYFNPNMISIYDEINKNTGKKDDKVNENLTIFTHEIEHIKQFGSSDFNNENGIESGFFRQYDDVAVNSLWDSWVLEAAAELKMADYLDTNTTLYAKKISYVKSYALSNIFDDDKSPDDLINATFNNDLSSAFKTLNIHDEKEKLDFLKLLYSIQITKYDCDDFWAYYEKSTGKTLTEEEKMSIKMDIRTDAVYNLTNKYYKGLINAVRSGKIKDVETVFHMMKVWELDVQNHLSYTEKDSLVHAKEFIIWHDNVQKSMFNELAKASNLSYDEVISMYDNYHSYVNVNGEKSKNFRFYDIGKEKEEYIEYCFDGYSVTYFADNASMVDYIGKSK